MVCTTLEQLIILYIQGCCAACTLHRLLACQYISRIVQSKLATVQVVAGHVLSCGTYSFAILPHLHWLPIN